MVQTVLAATSVDCAETSASNDTVRRMHDDNIELSIKCGLPIQIKTSILIYSIHRTVKIE